jgi:hypothetical protein
MPRRTLAAHVRCKDQVTCDLLVVGSGAGGLAAAVTAAHHGLDVLIVEKELWFGGASARSGGGLWIPGNALARRCGINDPREAASIYLQHHAGERFDAARVNAFLDHGPAMVDFIEKETHVKFFLPHRYPDYHPHLPGGAVEGRSIFASSMSAAPLGNQLARLRPPLRTATFMGMPVGMEDAAYLMTIARSVKSCWHVAKLLLQLGRDGLLHGRSMRLSMGNALVGGLAASAIEKGARLWTSAPATSLLGTAGAITGATVETAGHRVRVTARKAVILATGGFPHDSSRRSQLLPQAASSAEAWALLPYGNCGDGLRLGESVGGFVESRMPMPVALAPASRIETGEGALSCFPVFGSRATPGSIAVMRDGGRFVNEAASYHDFALALLKAGENTVEPEAFIIADHRALRRYGLGRAHPFPAPLRAHLKSGYLLRAATLADLARKAGIDPEALEATVERFNCDACTGKDSQFGRGCSAYDRRMGDATQGPNPCLGPVERAPFYAIRVVPSAVGTFAGLVTNEHAQVLRRDGAPIAGLYAAGNDLSSITGGDYVGGGCTIGPAMTFGYIAARHAAALPSSSLMRPTG